jgi:Spy/CpxP family protein refolding chaperone
MTKIKQHGMKMVRVALLAMCSAALVAAALAQGGGYGGGGGGQRGGMNTQAQLDRMTAALSLTADQQTSIKAILDQNQKDMMALRADTSLSDDDRMAKMQAMRKAQTDKIKAVLTDDQKPKYDAMMAQQRQRGPGGGGQGAPPPPPPSI